MIRYQPLAAHCSRERFVRQLNGYISNVSGGLLFANDGFWTPLQEQNYSFFFFFFKYTLPYPSGLCDIFSSPSSYIKCNERSFLITEDIRHL